MELVNEKRAGLLDHHIYRRKKIEKSWIELLGSPQADGIQNDSQTQTHITKGNSHEEIHIQSLLEN